VPSPRAKMTVTWHLMDQFVHTETSGRYLSIVSSDTCTLTLAY
jgi:hypothetical protein